MAFLLAKRIKCRFSNAAFFRPVASEARNSKDPQGTLILLPTRFQQWQLYSRPRGPLWRGRKAIGKEALHVLGEVKRNKNDNVSLGNTFRSKVARLLKVDLLAVLQELQRQSEVDLALRVFETIRKEVWYRPDIYLYKDMLHSLAKARRVGDCERLLKYLKAEGLPPDGLLLTEVMTAYLECDMLPQAMETFDEMRQGSVPPDLPAFKVLLRFLKKMGKVELRKKIRAECLEFYEGIIESKHKRREESEDEDANLETQSHIMTGEDGELGLELDRGSLSEGSDEELETEASESGTDVETVEDLIATYNVSEDEEMEDDRHPSGKHTESEEEMQMRRHLSVKFEENLKEEDI